MKRCIYLMILSLIGFSVCRAATIEWGNSEHDLCTYASGGTNVLAGAYDKTNYLVGCFVQLINAGPDQTNNPAMWSGDGVTGDDVVIKKGFMGQKDGYDGMMSGDDYADGTNGVTYYVRVWTASADDYENGIIPLNPTNYYGDSYLWTYTTYNPPLPRENYFSFGKTGGVTAALTPMFPPAGTGAVHVAILPAEAVATGAQWRIDTGSWYDNGTVVALATGEYSVVFKELGGWQRPASQAITVLKDATNEITGTYTEIPMTNMGYLLGFIEPLSAVSNGAQWRIANGDWQEDNTLLELVAGVYTVEFNAVTGYLSPTNVTTVTVDVGNTNAFIGYYEAMTEGWLHIDITPSEAVAAGAQWRILDGEWQDSGTSLALDAGLYTIEYSDVNGWTKPSSNESATISAGVTTTVSGVYAKIISDGVLIVTLEPQAAVEAGARWRLAGQVWHDSGAEVSLLAGDYYLEFIELTGWIAPTSQPVTIAVGETNEMTFTYQWQGSAVGNLTMHIDPAAAVDDGARWRVNGGTWKQGGATLSGLTPGLYEVTFMDLTYWTEPSVQTLMVYDAQTTVSTGTYAQTYGAASATISPASAITDGAKWRLTTGAQTAWQDSGVVLSNVATGVYTVEFLAMDGWVRPDSKSITVLRSQTASTYGYYTRDTGDLSCLIEPEGAVLAGAQWGLVSGSVTSWYNSGATAPGLGVGEHTVTFRAVDGWTTPADQIVVIGDNQTETITGAYGDPAMLLWLKMDETSGGTAYDSSGWNHDGAIKYGVALGEPGVIGGSYHFDGTSGYVWVPSFDVSGYTNFTVTFWVKRDAFRAGEAVFSKGGVAQTGSINIATATDFPLFPGQAVNATMMYDADNSTLHSGPLNSTSSWYFYALVIGEHEQQLYLDGVEVDSSAYDIGTFSPTSELYIGRNKADNGLFFDGSLDELRFYARALSTTELDGLQALPEHGRVACVISPPGAAAAGAQWMLTGTGSPDTGWQNSGTVISDVPTGTYDVVFRNLSGWITPGLQAVTVFADTRTDVTAVYTQLFGAVTCAITPDEAITAGAQWRLSTGDDTTWHDSGYLMTNVPVATYTLEFSDIDGWLTPASIAIRVTENGTVSEQRAYTPVEPEQGVLTCVITPETAIAAGAEWRILGDTWQSSGVLLTVDPGEYTVEFKELPGWVHPEAQVSDVDAGETNSLTAEYELIPPIEDGTLYVYLLPDKAVLAGAQWRISGGDWQHNGAYVQLPAGGYVVEFADVEHWETPVDTYVLMENGVTRGIRRDYSHGIVAYDFDGDRIADPAVFDKTNSVWQIIRSGDNQIEEIIWGWYETIPVPADYDGDELMDIAVYYPAGGDWYIYGSHWGEYIHQNVGGSNAAPVPGYYDYDMSDPDWSVNLVKLRLLHGRRAYQKYNGPYWTAFPNGKADACAFLWEEALWQVELSRSSEKKSKQLAGVYYSVPVPGDYDGDRFTDLATYGPDLGTWTIRTSSDGLLQPHQCGGGDTAVPAPGDYDGDGRTDMAVYDAATLQWVILYSTQGTITTNDWGKTNALPVVADYDGDGLDDMALYDRESGMWYILQSTDNEEREEALGGINALPVTLQYLLNEWYDISPFPGDE
ncbi:MAG: hypothetical protein EOM20_04360 [Spartobacteria bacterium]|nr:hypothetical protein [Spartobacteria bacterium]